MNSEEEQLVAETFDAVLSELVINQFRQAAVSFLPQFSRELVREAVENGELQ